MRFILSFLLLAGLTVGLACQATTTTQSDETSVGTDGANRITLAGAKKHFDANDAIFVDTRAEVVYKQEHIKDSINLPAESIETRWKEIPTDKMIIAYCSWPQEHTSASLVLKLKEKGITNAFALIGGTKAWKDAGYPMEGEKLSQPNSNK